MLIKLDAHHDDAWRKVSELAVQGKTRTTPAEKWRRRSPAAQPWHPFKSVPHASRPRWMQAFAWHELLGKQHENPQKRRRDKNLELPLPFFKNGTENSLDNDCRLPFTCQTYGCPLPFARAEVLKLSSWLGGEFNCRVCSSVESSFWDALTNLLLTRKTRLQSPYTTGTV